MNSIAFFPWFYMKNEITFGNFLLSPYERGKKPYSEENDIQKKLDSIFSKYRVHEKRLLARATIMRPQNTELFESLNEDIIGEMFVFSELFAFANLSQRRFFDSLDYCNRDAFLLIIQQFENVESGISITYRRRDGTNNIYYYGDNFIERKPKHINSFDLYKRDYTIIDSLTKAQTTLNTEDWNQIYESIVNFNMANKDGHEINENLELLLLNGAFERILGVQSKEDELAKSFVETLVPKKSIDIINCIKFKSMDQNRFKKSKFVRDLWIRDFFKLRGNLAHGKLSIKYPAIWNLKEHLLYASYIFPIILKCKLFDKGLYQFTDDDIVYQNVFEKLLNINPFEEYHDEEDSSSGFLWTKVIGDAYWGWDDQ